MKILTLTQPYATLIALSAKHIETRSWLTRYRGPIAIHAGAGLGPVGGMRGLHDLAGSPPFFAALQPAMMRLRQRYNRDGVIEEWPEFDAALLPIGQIVAVANLVVCVPTESARYIGGDHDGWSVEAGPRAGKRWPLTDQERAFGDYSPGRWAWLLADICPLRTPLPYRGALGLRDLPPDVIAQLTEGGLYATTNL